MQKHNISSSDPYIEPRAYSIWWSTYSHRMITRTRHSPLAVCLLAALALGLSACGSGGDGGSEASSAAPAESSSAPASSAAESTPAAAGVEQTGILAAPDQADGAFTYDEIAVPAGAEMTLTAMPAGTGTVIELSVTGFAPDRAYGSHAHVNPCGPTGDDAGPHFQNEQDPVTPSVDPAYANPMNEIWLDFTTDAQGAGTATAEVPFTFAERAPASVIIHEMPTATGPGEAGTAGERPACLTVPFDQLAS